MSLFRKEAIDYAARRDSTGVVLRRPRFFAYAAWAVVALVIATISFGVFGSYSARVPASGVLRADRGMVTVVAPMAGVINRSGAIEGDPIAMGQLLATIEAPRKEASGENVTHLVARKIDDRRAAAARSSQSQLASLDEREQGLQSQLQAADAELERLAAELKNAKRQAEIAKIARDRLRDIHKKGFVSDLQLQQGETEQLQREAAVLALQRLMAGTDRNRAQLLQSLAELPAQRDALGAVLAQDLAALEQEAIENNARGGLGISAPVKGTLTAEFVESGQVVQPGQSLFAILPENAALEPLYRVIVRLEKQSVLAYGREEALLPGMALEADIMLESRRLIEWMLEPLYSLQGRISG